MAFSMFSAQASPIAIDFGSTSIKFLQTTNGDRGSLVAAACLPIPESMQGDFDRVLAFCADQIPGLLRQAGFKGRRVVCTVPSTQTFIQHMQVTGSDGVNRDALLKGQLQMQTGCSPDAVVVRSIEVCNVNRDGETKTEMICLAMGRDVVMRFVDLLRRCKLEVVGVHTEPVAMVRAFDHLNRRKDDHAITTMYVDLGFVSSVVAITHGRKLVFARSIPFGGRSFDQHIAQSLNCDSSSARAHRLSLGPNWQSADAQSPTAAGMTVLNAAVAGAASDAKQKRVAAAAMSVERRNESMPAEFEHNVGTPTHGLESGVDFTELFDTLSDELSMCVRYHQQLFRDRAIDRVIFLGGESRQIWLCQRIIQRLELPGHLGDPLARLRKDNVPSTPGVDITEPQPGWAVVRGLCSAPTDL